MKISNSQKRIRELMDMYGLSQTELCNRTGIQKSALSNYLSGTREPRQDQLSLIADPFGINPAWLMGYDVPMKMDYTIHIDEGYDVLAELMNNAELRPYLIAYAKNLLEIMKERRKKSNKEEEA